MTRIAVIGGTGYAGSNIIHEALSRGHTVVSVARSVPSERIEGATYIEGTLLDVPGLVEELQGVEVVVSAVAARGDMLGHMRDNVAQLVANLPTSVRIGVVGGAGGSLIAPEGERLIDQPSFTEEYKPEALEAIGILEDLQADDRGHDWFYIHPAGGFGAWAAGERTGTYRDGGDVLVTDEKGDSYISGPDFGVAVVDEIENPKHSRERFTVGY
ncbi:NAD(P)H-binding protein [Microbacterium lacus]|uniref:NAD(P)-dependent oxidoreductase n=1 Tax=Microbacterium lacus TaxID=415217 RepID=UPI00384C7436